MYEPLHSYLIEYIYKQQPDKVITFDELKKEILEHFNKQFVRLLDMRLDAELHHLQHQGVIHYDKVKSVIKITIS